MQTKRPSLVITAALFSGCAISALAQSPSGKFSITIPASSTSVPADAGVKAHTNVRTLASTADFNVKPNSFGPPFPGYLYEDPASLACVYNLQPQVPGCNPNITTLPNPVGGSKAIAIVDAYDDPNAYTDLQTFSAQFGVAAISPSSFVVTYAPYGGPTPGSCVGTATRPAVDSTGGWEIEESLDIEYAHAMAPSATLYLVEAQSNSDADLLCAVSVASALVSAAGGGEVSMSWGGGEFSTETAYDSVFTTPKVVYFAAAGDSLGTSWPSVSPNVVSVGGTSLSRNPVTGSFLNENVWQDGGGGPSIFEARPSYQSQIQSIVGASRGSPDMALDANPYTGVWVLDDFLPPEGCTPLCWYVVGGTSVASPTLAGIVNGANNFSASSSSELTTLYGDPRGDFNDITLGSCGSYLGYFAAAGWDFCSGLGSPNSYFALVPITVTVNPPSKTLGPNAKQTFTATVTGTSNQLVTWSISPATGAGTIDQSGSYTAPAIITVAAATITATSQADSAKTGTASITLTESVGTCPPPASASWTGCYYSDPALTTLVFSRNDTAINFNWPTSTPGGNIPSGPFSVRWQGDFIFQGANYNFFVTSDAPPAIYLDGVQLPPYGVVCTAGCEFTVGMTAGSHLLEVDYKHTTSTASFISLGWATR